MEKTTICSYWEKKSCRFMNKPENCIFAHGMEDLKKISCIYGSNCYNVNCNFNHENNSIKPVMVYDIPIIKLIKDKKVKKNKKKTFSNVEENSKKEKDIILCENKNEEKIQIVKIVNKHKNINESINVLNTNYNKMLSMVDDFYIKKYDNMLYSKNKYISKKINDNYKLISYLRKINIDKDLIIHKITDENERLKKKDYLENTKKNTIHANMEDLLNKKKKPKDQNKLKSLYNKYINIHKIFMKYKNYKLINLDEIKEYTKDKNIYKVKQRSCKVYDFYTRYKKGILKELLPVSTIFKMVF